jgi:aryl-alcohol dehydrogenase-like predicted oxidoreductase
MQTRELGTSGLVVPAIGLGCMGMSTAYGERDDESSTAAIQHAIDIGAGLLDTSDAYANGVNEELVGKAIAGRREHVILCSKFGNIRLPDGGRAFNGKPEYVAEACDKSLKRLGVDHIDLYYQHRVDPETPIEERHMEGDILPVIRELGIGLAAYSPLGRGFLSGTIRRPADLIEKDRRHDHPRFHPENLARNVALLPVLEEVAAERGCTMAQAALAWLLGKGDDIVPLVGTKSAARVDENLAALDLTLDDADIARLEGVFTPGVTAGTRYPERQMKSVGI